jgi:hypothetical protein
VRGPRVTRRLSLEAQLDEQQSELDQVLAEVRSGVRDARHYDELEERAHSIAGGLKAAFRTSRGKRS